MWRGLHVMGMVYISSRLLLQRKSSGAEKESFHYQNGVSRGVLEEK